MRVAVISDVHGNLLALEAVLADIALHAADAVVSLGDHLSGPFDPRGTADRFLDLDIPCVRGNHDRFIVEGRENDWAVDVVARAAIDARHRAWLSGMPATQVFASDVFMCHGTPADDNTLWLDSIGRDGVINLLPREFVEAEALGFDFPVLLCGHSHVPRTVRLMDGRLVVNPGSAGMPIALGTPDARYALLDRRDGKWSVSLRAIPYEHDAAAAQARAAGFANWAEAVTTGWSRPGEL